MNKIKKRRIKNKFFANKNRILAIFVVIFVVTLSSAYAINNSRLDLSGRSEIKEVDKCNPFLSFNFEIQNSWQSSETNTTYAGTLTVRNEGDTPVNDWEIRLKGPNDLSLNLNAEYTIDQGYATITPTGNYTWNSVIDANSTKEIYIQFTTVEQELNLEYFIFNECKVIDGQEEHNELRNISLNSTELSMKIGELYNLVVSKTPTNAEVSSITYSSSDDSVASVTSNGVITANGEGTATITVVADEKSATCVVTVSNETLTLESITLAPGNTILNVDDTINLQATTNPANVYTELLWTSSDPTIASVDQNGKVTALSRGVCTISASYNGVTGTSNITVFEPISNGDLNIEYSTSYVSSTDVHYNMVLTNTGDNDISRIQLQLALPTGTTWNFWNNWPAMFSSDETGTILTTTNSNLSLSSGSYMEFSGMFTVPSGYSASDYSNPTISILSVE